MITIENIYDKDWKNNKKEGRGVWLNFLQKFKIFNIIMLKY